jgi:hypothetical protein
MKKIIRLTESDLTRLVKKVIKESSWIDRPGTPGHIDYLRDAERNSADRDRENEERKYHIPSYNPKTGGGWKPNQIKEFVFNKFELELPDDVIEVNRYGFVNDYTVRQWVKSNIRLTERDLTKLVRQVVSESSKNEEISKMAELKEYLKELKDEGIIHNDVSNHIIYLVKKIIKKEN